MEIKDALYKTEQSIYNRANNKWLQATETVLAALETFRKYKRFNKSHEAKLMEAIEGNGLVHSVSFRKHRYFDDRYEFSIFYSQNEWSSWHSEPRSCNYQHSFSVEGEYSGENIYQRMLQRLESHKKYESPVKNIEDYKIFYNELETLCAKHACSQDALQTLFTR